MSNPADDRVIARAAEQAGHLDTLTRMYGRLPDLEAMPGPHALRALGQGLALLAAELLARADDLDPEGSAVVASRAVAAVDSPALTSRGTPALRSPGPRAG